MPRCPGIIRGQRHATGQAAVTIDGPRLNWQDSRAVRDHSPTGIESKTGALSFASPISWWASQAMELLLPLPAECWIR